MQTIQSWIPQLLSTLDETPYEEGLTSRILFAKVLKLQLKLEKMSLDETLLPLQTLKKCCAFWNQKLDKSLKLSLEHLETIIAALPESILQTSFSHEVLSLILKHLDTLLNELLNVEMASLDTPSMTTTSTSSMIAVIPGAHAGADSVKSSTASGLLNEMKGSYAIAQTSSKPTGPESSSITFLQNGDSKNYQIAGHPSDFVLTLNLYTTENLFVNGQKNFDKNKLFGVSQMPIQDNSEISAALETLMGLLKKDFMARNPTAKDSMERKVNENQYGTRYDNKYTRYSNDTTQPRYKPYVPWKNLNNRRY